MAKTTLEHVAQKAQVSISTVSRVLNGKSGVNEGTRRRILSIIAGSNYSTRESDSNGAGTRVLGLLVPVAAQDWGIQSNFIQESLQAVTDAARRSNYVTMVGAFNPELGDRIEDRMILDRKFAGVLLFRTRDEVQDSKALREYGIPYIVVNRLLPGTPIHYLGVDHRAVSRGATEFLIQSGYRRIALLSGDPRYVSHELYRRGFEDAHAAAKLPILPPLMQTIELRAEEGYAATRRVLEASRRPDALILPSDRSAVGALKALRDLRLRAPDDIGVLVLDGTKESAFADPPLTAVEVPWYDMLALGSSLLIKMIEDRPAIEKIGIRFSTRLVERESTRRRRRRG
jgi:DNA-binding LacI/PurR family transcriptional regulator